MFCKVVTGAIFASVLVVSSIEAQTVSQIGGPAELPSASFKGDQYVDSRGCVFLRAGYGGRPNWVPRVSRARKVLCGFPPTFGPKPVIDVADEPPEIVVKPPMVVVAAPVIAAKPNQPRGTAPMATVASKMMPKPALVASEMAAVTMAKPARYANTSPVQSYVSVASNAVPAGKIGCYASAPVPEVVRLQGGGTAVVCTRGDGTTTGWRSPIYPKGAGVGPALRKPVMAQNAQQSGQNAAASATYAQNTDIPAVPKGYKLAWKDDRLNPNRGKGTAAGQAAQDQIWTKTVPAQLISDVTKAKANKVAKRNVAVSTMGGATSPVQPAASGATWVQIGTFGVAQNAQGAAQRLVAMGLPIAKSQIIKSGKALQIVLAGPFATGAEVTSAMNLARQAGFADAFIR